MMRDRISAEIRARQRSAALILKKQEMSIKHLSASASADEICAALADDGCVVVDNVVRPEVMDEVAHELRPY